VIVQDNPRRRLEEFVSGIGMMTLYDTLRDQYPQSALTHVDPVTPRDILDRVGDPLTLAILNEMSQWLGRALAWACTAFNPDAVIIGGGFGQALMPYIQTDVLNYVREHTLPLIHQHLEIRLSSVQESAIGPACFVWLNPGVTGDD
jgi:predicted NBD/HSP70 family sugar kinase